MGHTWPARSPPAQPVLRRRGDLQGRDPGWRAACDCRQRPVRSRSGQAERASDQPQGLADEVRGAFVRPHLRRSRPPNDPEPCSRRRRIKYRYYISSALLQGRPQQAGSVNRIAAREVEVVVIKAVRDRLTESPVVTDALLIQNHVTRVEVQSDQLVVELTDAIGLGSKRKRKRRQVIEVPWRKTTSRRRREILVPESQAPQSTRPIRSENRALLVASVARGRRWLHELMTEPTANTESIADREGCSVRRVNMTISLSFLAPDLVKAAIDGRLPHGMGVVRLSDMPAEWSRQHLMLGFNT